jgi:hypothetical protein
VCYRLLRLDGGSDAGELRELDVDDVVSAGFVIVRRFVDAESNRRKKILDERWASYERHPESAMTLDELQKKVAVLRK